MKLPLIQVWKLPPAVATRSQEARNPDLTNGTGSG